MRIDAYSGFLAFVFILVLERSFPFFSKQKRNFSHTENNLTLALMNALLQGALAGILISILAWGSQQNFGLLRQTPLWEGIVFCLGLVLFDLWMYIWHRANHEIYFLWRFHRAHHTDLQMDASTALRFHPVEIIFSFFINLPVLALIGLSLPCLTVYKAIMYPVIILHHSNVNVPERFERIFKLFFVMPSMHRVHHSVIPQQTNSNYGSVLPVWDKLFGSFVERHDCENIHYGIGKFDEPRWQGLKGTLLLPFF